MHTCGAPLTASMLTCLSFQAGGVKGREAGLGPRGIAQGHSSIPKAVIVATTLEMRKQGPTGEVTGW